MEETSLAQHDQAKLLADLALMLAAGGEHLVDVSSLRVERGVYKPMASDPTISRLLAVLTGDVEMAEHAINASRRDAQRPPGVWPETTHLVTGRRRRIRIDGAGSIKKTLEKLVERRVSNSIGDTLPAKTPELYGHDPEGRVGVGLRS